VPGTIPKVSIVADSAEATGLKWAAPAGGGKVLQVVSATTSTATTIASTSYTDTTLTATITPSSATSRILVFLLQQVTLNRNTGAQGVGVRIDRSGTVIFTRSQDYGAYLNVNQAAGWAFAMNYNLTYMDSPATTSALTYKTQGRAFTTSDSGQVVFQQNSEISSIILMEIGA
jgi:hypothetical protein